MAQSETSAVPTLTLERTIEAPVARVYAAWTDPALFARWMAPPPSELAEIAMDVRPGGRYRFAVRAEEQVHTTSGEYEEVVPDRRLVMTWRYEGPFGDDETPSRLEVELREAGPRTTELTLVHSRARDAFMRDLLSAGWAECLDDLAAVAAGA